MSNAAKLKRKAADFEQKKQYNRALEAYLEVIASADGTEEVDIPLYNRVGDLYLREGNTEEAVKFYEKAVDLYSDAGFFNNAIALCNKILRHTPNRASIFYKLGKISAKKGFNSDAKKNFLEYADRMQKSGKIDESFRALKEFADLCPGQDDIRLMLAEQLSRADRKTEALEQLHVVYESFDAEGRASEAAATLERMRAIDPSVEPRKSDKPRERSNNDGLIFLDVDSPSVRTVEEELKQEAANTESVLGLEPTSLAIEEEVKPAEEKRTTKHDLLLGDLPTIEEIRNTAEYAVPTDLLPTDLPLIEDGPAVATQEHNAEEQNVQDVTSATIDINDVPALVDDSAIAGLVSAVNELPPALDIEPTSFGGVEENLPPMTLQESLVQPLDSPGSQHDEGNTAFGVGELSSTPTESIEETVRPDDEFVDLGDWLREDEQPKSTRMVAQDRARRDDEQADFSEMLQKFKAGVAANVDEGDTESHYDLGVAYKEMGLLDESIAEFQKALRTGSDAGSRIRSYEALGQCFIEKGQFEVAITLLSRALKESGLEDEDIVGVLYLLGYASEALERKQDAASYYQRVFAIDIEFRDVADRLKAVSST